VIVTGRARSWYRAMRIAVFALLFCNTGYYAYAGTLSKGLDAAAWLVLLALFMLETGFAVYVRTRPAAFAMRTARLIAAVGVCAAGIGYVIEHDRLDTINSALWIAVVVLLEIEVRHPREIARWRTAFTTVAATLYSALAILVLIWAWRGEWFDAYDALLWLIAFATIEMDVLAVAGRDTAV
jgi:hypothetical protein